MIAGAMVSISIVGIAAVAVVNVARHAEEMLANKPIGHNHGSSSPGFLVFNSPSTAAASVVAFFKFVMLLDRFFF